MRAVRGSAGRSDLHLPPEVMQEPDNLTLRAGIEAGGDLVAEEDLGVGDEFHGETQAALHRNRLLGKLGVHSALEAVALDRRLGLSTAWERQR